MPLEWNDAYGVGHADIDAQHQGLFRLTLTLMETPTPQGRIAAAKRLFDHTRDHFGHEESLMRSLHYPEIEAHIAEHRILLEKLDVLIHALIDGTLAQGELERFITDWLVSHMTNLDAKLSNYLKS